jgi:hypothetical protein
MPDARERDYRQRKYMRLDALVRAWASGHAIPIAAAAVEVVALLRQRPDCLVVACRTLDEINRGVPASVRAARRQTELARIERLAAEQGPPSRFQPFVVRTDRLLAVLIERGESVPAFLPLPLE